VNPDGGGEPEEQRRDVTNVCQRLDGEGCGVLRGWHCPIWPSEVSSEQRPLRLEKHLPLATPSHPAIAIGWDMGILSPESPEPSTRFVTKKRHNNPTASLARARLWIGQPHPGPHPGGDRRSCACLHASLTGGDGWLCTGAARTGAEAGRVGRGRARCSADRAPVTPQAPWASGTNRYKTRAVAASPSSRFPVAVGIRSNIPARGQDGRLGQAGKDAERMLARQ
jgi:hypothetical protein